MAWSPRSWFGAQWFGPWFGPVAAAPGTTVRPGRGVAVVSGHAPTVVATTGGPATVTPDVAALTVTGYVPTVNTGGVVGGHRRRAWMKRIADLTERFVLRPTPKPVAVAADRAIARLGGHAPTVYVTLRRASTVVSVSAPVAAMEGHAPVVVTTGNTRAVGVIAPSGAVAVQAFAPEVRTTGVQWAGVGTVVCVGHPPVVRAPRPARVVVSTGPTYVTTVAPDVAVTTRVPWTDDDEDDEISALLLLVAALHT